MSESACPQDPNRVETKALRDPVCRWTIVVPAAMLFPLALQIASDRAAPIRASADGLPLNAPVYSVTCTTRRVYDVMMSAGARRDKR